MLKRLLAAIGLTTLVFSASAVPAFADNAGQTGASQCAGEDYCVAVTYTGSAAPSGGGGGSGVVAAVPPLCWYELWGTPKQVLKEIQAHLDEGHCSGCEGILLNGPIEEFEKAAENANKDTKWYKLNCTIDMTDPRAREYAGEEIDLYGYLGSDPYARQARLIPNGTAPPAPAVDVEVLRDAAYDSMDIPDPTIERNPKMQGSAATLVTLPTYFYTDGGYRDTWDITASVGPVSATVVATSGDWTFTSPAGGDTCTHAEFTTPWTGQGEAGCAIAFTRSSNGYAAGFPVTATSTWDATWTGVPGPAAPEPLPPVTTSVQVDVPVVESQALVTDVG